MAVRQPIPDNWLFSETPQGSSLFSANGPTLLRRALTTGAAEAAVPDAARHQAGTLHIVEPLRQPFVTRFAKGIYSAAGHLQMAPL